MEEVGGMQPKRLREGSWGQVNKCASEKRLCTNTSGYVLPVLCLLKNMFCDAHCRHEWFQCLSCWLLFRSPSLTSSGYTRTHTELYSVITLLQLYTHVYTCTCTQFLTHYPLSISRNTPARSQTHTNCSISFTHTRHMVWFIHITSNSKEVQSLIAASCKLLENSIN